MERGDKGMEKELATPLGRQKSRTSEMRQRCDPSALIQWLSFNRPSPHFNFQFLRAVETVSELRSWCYSIDCDEACVIKKKKKRKISGKQSGIGNMAEEEF